MSGSRFKRECHRRRYEVIGASQYENAFWTHWLMYAEECERRGLPKIGYNGK